MRSRQALWIALLALGLGAAAPVLVLADEGGASGNPEPTALRQLRELQERKAAQDQASRDQQAASAKAAEDAVRAMSSQFQALHPEQQQPQAPPVQAPPQQQPQAADRNDDPEVAAAMTERQKMQDVTNRINVLVPHSASQGAAGGSGAAGADALPASLASMGALLKNPMFLKFANRMGDSVKDPEFMKAANAILKNPNMRWLYVSLVVYIIVFAVITRRAKAATDRLLMKLLIQVTFTGAFFVGYFTVAYLILGPPLVTVMTAVGGAALAAVQ